MTSLGSISWSDDGQQLSYKSLEFTMNSLQWFLHDQVQEAQDQLHDLLLLPSRDADMQSQRVPQLHLARLRDDPTVSLANYSFLDNKRNEGILGGKERYLLHRVRQEAHVRRYFFKNPETLTWNTSHVQQYVERARAFLQRLLLLIHMTGGQPARGTELLTLRWRNSAHSEVRNIFVESGIVSFVTSYHKKYSASSSAKLIHRYLPPEVGELLVYYL
ncbi:unnamed protein product [Periconia digitata]|uniref:Uncharacterized protein n=1 Tax=Periconia digitata TaxID=1303443 RepID=A0A9W4UQX6_9PLEO|nr:unnamed protein product [Periconia digitata]